MASVHSRVPKARGSTVISATPAGIFALPTKDPERVVAKPSTAGGVAATAAVTMSTFAERHDFSVPTDPLAPRPEGRRGPGRGGPAALPVALADDQKREAAVA